MGNCDPVVIDFDEIKHETELAYLFVIDDNEVWLPKSQCLTLDVEAREVEIPEWLAVDKGLV